MSNATKTKSGAKGAANSTTNLMGTGPHVPGTAPSAAMEYPAHDAPGAMDSGNMEKLADDQQPDGAQADPDGPVTREEFNQLLAMVRELAQNKPNRPEQPQQMQQPQPPQMPQAPQMPQPGPPQQQMPQKAATYPMSAQDEMAQLKVRQEADIRARAIHDDWEREHPGHKHPVPYREMVTQLATRQTDEGRKEYDARMRMMTPVPTDRLRVGGEDGNVNLTAERAEYDGWVKGKEERGETVSLSFADWRKL